MPAANRGLTTPAVLACFALWYVLNVVYNYANKKALTVLPLPYLMAAAQIGAGGVHVLAVWLLGFRSPPKLERRELIALIPVGMYHGIGQLVTVLSLGAGSLRFVNVIKALEPFFTVILAMIYVPADIVPLPVLLTLVPLVGGVAIVSSAENMEFGWLCCACAMGSNVFFSLRAVLSKVALKESRPDANLGPANLFAVLTIIAFLTVLPIALVMDGPNAENRWSKAVSTGRTPAALVHIVFVSGVSFYLYNEVSFFVLDAVDPVTHAVGNTMKRVILILLSGVALGLQMTTLSATGSALAVAGVCAYCVAKAKTSRASRRRKAD